MVTPGSPHPSHEALSEYHDGELDPPARLAVRRHLLECATCRSYLEELQAARELHQRSPMVRPPMSLRREMYRRIEVEGGSRRPFHLPGAISLPNLVGLAVTALLIVSFLPQLLNVWAVMTDGAARATAAQPAQGPRETAEVIDEAPLVDPVVTVVPPPPTPTAAPPTATAAARTSPTRSANTQAPAAQQAQPTTPPATATARPGRAPASGPAGTPVATQAAAQATTPAPTAVPPTATTTPMRVVSGQISSVDRKQRVFSVFNADDASRPWQVQLTDATRIVQRDGQPLKFEDVGLADQVEVSGTESAELTRTLAATTVRVLVSAVAPATRQVRVLVLLDGADSLRPPQYGFTGDWIRRLNDTGYAVTPLEPARISAGASDLKDFSLIVIGYPATLSPTALQAVRASRLPILNAEPRLVQALGLGMNLDPEQPTRDFSGNTVEIAGQASPITRGLSGETVLANESLHRTPIVANGAVLGTITENGAKRAVWSVTGTTMYLGFWRSANGHNHNGLYWTLFDRSVLWLLGRDPSTVRLPAAGK
ncbi:MAG TPA: anti-sigma factor [Chloroflexota bacterium]|nr:anti-sigma factor [Chloroflexota bacterium]